MCAVAVYAWQSDKFPGSRTGTTNDLTVYTRKLISVDKQTNRKSVDLPTTAASKRRNQGKQAKIKNFKKRRTKLGDDERHHADR
jgi:hypothetical protein